MSELVRYDKGDTHSTITMDDGRVNALSLEMLAALNAALDRAEADEATVLLCGREKIFSGGFDLATFQRGGQDLATMLDEGARLSLRLLSFPTPVVMACSGHAVAMGVFVLLSGDLRIGAKGSYRVHANEVEIGLILPRFAVEVCRQRLTPAAFTRTAILAEPWSPEDAQAAGFLDLLVERDDLARVAAEKAASMARLDRAAHVATKQRVREKAIAAMEEALAADKAEWGRTFG